MARTIETKAIISAQDKTGSTFAAVANKLRQMQNQTDAASRRIGGMTGRAAVAAESRTAGLLAGGRALIGAAAVYGVGSQISKSVNDWADLELAVTRLGNTGEVTTDKIKGAISTFRQLGPQMGVSAKQVAEGAELFVAAGIDFDKAVAATPTALKAAKASGAELNDVVNAGVAGLNNLGLTVPQLDHAFDIMAKGGKLGSFELKNMAKELPSVAARAKALGMSGTEGLGQIVAMLETTRKTAATGEDAANNLVNFLDKITAGDTAKHFKKQGVDLEKELKAGLKRGENYVDTSLKLIEKMTGGDEFKIGALFPDRQARLGVKALLDFKTFYNQTRDELRRNAIGTNTRDFDRSMETAREKINRMSSSWQVLRTRLGEKIGVPMLQPVLDNLNEIFRRAEEIEQKMKKGEDTTSPGQLKFNRLMNGIAGPQMRGSDQSPFDPSVERARRDMQVRDLETAQLDKLEALQKKAAALQASVSSTPFYGKRLADGLALKETNAEIDAILPKIEALQQAREAIQRIMIEGAAGRKQLADYNSLAIRQPVAEAPGGVTKTAFGPNMKGYANVNGALMGGSNPILQPPKPEPVVVSLDPASKVDVRVSYEVKAGSTLIELVEQAKSAVAAGNARASIGTVGKTGVGSTGAQ